MKLRLGHAQKSRIGVFVPAGTTQEIITLLRRHAVCRLKHPTLIERISIQWHLE
jgi:hypothetical protein